MTGTSAEAGDRADLVSALEAFPGRLTPAVLVVVARPVPPGEWTPAEVVRHLIAVETDVHQARLRDLATVRSPAWDWAEPGPWPGEPTLTVVDLLARFDGLRAGTVATIRALDDAGWRRTGTHSRLGVWDVAGLLRNAVTHDEGHLAGLA